MSDDTDFADLLIRLVRDKAIGTCDALAAGRLGGPVGERWKAVLADDEAGTAVRELIPDIVDHAVFYLLHALDGNDLPMAWKREDGTLVSLAELGRGEMAGRLFGDDGWIARYSSQRHVD